MIHKAELTRYARTLAIQAEADRVLPPLIEGLTAWLGALDSSTELAVALGNPALPRPVRLQLLGEVGERLAAHPVAQRVMTYLVGGERLNQLPELVRALQVEADRLAGRVVVRVKSARPLGIEQQRRLSEALGRRLERHVQLQLEVEPALIGGLVASVEDLTFDGSVRHRLRRLGEYLRQEAVTESAGPVRQA